MSRSTRIFSDLDAAFNINPRTKDVAARYDDNAIRGALRNLIHTRHYERPFQPELGCQINNLLFENMDELTLALAERTIRNAIIKYEPRVELLTVSVAQTGTSAVYIEIVYKLRNSAVPNIFTTTFTRVR
jgi:phage baseplate assembly protein W